jgi:hypothetical protein
MSEQDEIVDSPGFIRQRRNLILASLVLAFAQGAHLTILKLSFFGAEGTIDAPVSTVPFLLVLWLYFLWRYWQAFNAVGRKPTMNRYREIKKILLERIAVKRGLIPYRDKQPPLLRGTPGEPRAWMPHDDEEPTDQGAKVLLVTDMVEQSSTGAPSQKHLEVDFSRTEMRKIRARAILHLIITADEFSEYYLPFGIAAIPFLVWIRQIWP